jgi:hypothetical protein
MYVFVVSYLLSLSSTVSTIPFAPSFFFNFAPALPHYSSPLPCAPLLCWPIYQAIVFDFHLNYYYFLSCIITVIILSVIWHVPCPVFVWSCPGLLAAGPCCWVVGGASIERRLSLLIFFTLFLTDFVTQYEA